jgi:penicillin-binding protein 1A
MAAPSTARARIAIANPSDGGILYWTLKLYGFAALVLLWVGMSYMVCVYKRVAGSAPPTPDLANYTKVAPKISTIYASDGTSLGDFASEWRMLVAYDRMPDHLIKAFLAAEDHEFFSHNGIYLKGIIRAAWANITRGGFVQGGSTITQQVAKQFMKADRTLWRKAREAVVARRLEAKYTKEQILSVYLNHIFLGSGAYGVQAAAWRYFSRNVWDLDLAQAALIAGLANAPSLDSPLVNPERALARRNNILDRMERHGFADPGAVEKAKAKSLELEPFKSGFGESHPYFAEHVRRYVGKQYGKDVLMKAGLTIETTMVPYMDTAAYENVEFNARKQDKRQGWRGPEAIVEGASRKLFLERARKLYDGKKLEPGRHYVAMVESSTRRSAKVLIGSRTFKIPYRLLSWARRWSATEYDNDRPTYNATVALKPGYVVWVSLPPTHIGKFRDWNVKRDEKGKPDSFWKREGPARKYDDDVVQLDQTPHPQTSLFTIDWNTGYVLAMVGGSDYSRSEYNRVVQACRQPGSTYKPIYYALALISGFHYYTMLNDVAKKEAEVDPVTGKVWTPSNYEGKVETETSLESALVWSKNVPSVALFKKLGGEAVEKWARKLGFTSPIIADKALALGASCVFPWQLGRAFAIYARNGKWLDVRWVRRITDHSGKIIEDNTVIEDPALTPASRFDRVFARAGVEPKQAVSARAAFLITKLLREMVRRGHGRMIREEHIIAAGKTGTSSATMDTWMVGFTHRWLTVSWMGDDLRVRPLGRRDASYLTALPQWGRYMYEVLNGRETREIPTAVPPGVDPDDQGGKRRSSRHRQDHSKGG